MGKTFSTFVGAKFCISTNNGTDALILSLKALNIGHGDEVITVTNTFYATVGAIVTVGAKAVLVDCDDRYQIDITKIEKNITKRTKAIVPVHWGGASPDMISIIKIAKKYKIPVVEDACMGIGGICQNKHPGLFGKVSAFSMHPLKSLNAIGDGGMVVTNDKKLYNWMVKYRNHGMVDRNHIDFWGQNIRLQPLQAVVALEGIKRLKKTIKIRNKNAMLYDRYLKDLSPFVKIPQRFPNCLETFALYMCLFRDRDNLLSFLIKKGIEVKIHYPIPLHKQKAAIKDCIFDKKDLKNSDVQANQLLTLPVHQFLSKEHIYYTIKNIYKFYGRKIIL